MDIIKSLEHEQLKNKIQDLHVGDTVKVHQRIKEGNKQRIQVYEGIVIKKQNGGINATFTVRRLAYGVGSEKTFLINSPLVEKIEVVRVGHSRRAKLYYLRERTGKAAKTRENIGAKVETKFLVQKEDVEPEVEEVKEEAKTEAKAEINEVKEVKEEVKAEVKEEAKAEVKEEKEEKEEVKAEAKEEAKTEVKEETKAEEEPKKEETDDKE